MIKILKFVYYLGMSTWYVIFGLLGLLVGLALLFLMSDAVYTIYQQYMKHRKF